MLCEIVLSVLKMFDLNGCVMKNELIERYLNKGFGSMNKNDFEVAIFDEIMKDDEYKDLSDFKLSVKLRVPESKIKRLRYEANLKYQVDDCYYLIKFLDILSKSDVNNDGNTIKLIVTDKGLRNYIKNEMYERNKIVEFSSNSDVVLTNVKDLTVIVGELYGPEKKEEIAKQYNKEVFKDYIKDCVLDIVKNPSTLISILFGI